MVHTAKVTLKFAHNIRKI